MRGGNVACRSRRRRSRTIDNAEAALRSAEAQVAQAQAAVQQRRLVPQFDRRGRSAECTSSRRRSALAQAQLDQAELNLAWTKVTAPQDGWVTKRNVELGNYVQAGQSMMALVTPEVWVTANFKEIAARAACGRAEGRHQRRRLSGACS